MRIGEACRSGQVRFMSTIQSGQFGPDATNVACGNIPPRLVWLEVNIPSRHMWIPARPMWFGESCQLEQFGLGKYPDATAAVSEGRRRAPPAADSPENQKSGGPPRGGFPRRIPPRRVPPANFPAAGRVRGGGGNFKAFTSRRRALIRYAPRLMKCVTLDGSFVWIS